MAKRAWLLYRLGLKLKRLRLVAESFSMMGDKPGIAMSGQGFEEFMKRASNYDSFTLEVR